MIDICIFTNTIPSAPSTKIIRQCYNSFADCFGNFKPTVFCDINPRKNAFCKYEQNLKNIFENVIETKSLSDGYIKAVSLSKADYLFILEGDWVF